MGKPTEYIRGFSEANSETDDEMLPSIRAPDEPDPFENVGSMLDELREGGEYAELSVFGRPKQTGPNSQRGNAFLMVCGANDYTLAELMSHIQESWGEGIYTIKGKRGGKYAGQRTITIGPPPPKPGQPSTGAQTDSGDNVVKQLFEMFQQQIKQQSDGLAVVLNAILNKLDRPQIDPLALQRDTINMLASMRDVFGPSTPQTQPQKTGSTLTQLKELLEIKELIASDSPSGEKDGLMDMAKTFLPALLSTAQVQAQTQTHHPAPISNTPKRIEKPRNTEQAPKLSESPAMLELLKGVTMLVGAAKNDSDVELYAELIADQFDVEQIKRFITPEDSIDRLSRLVPEIKQHREWFLKLRATLVEWIAETEKGESVSTAEEESNNVATNGNPER